MKTQNNNIGNLELDVILSESLDESKDLLENDIEEVNSDSLFSGISNKVGKTVRFLLLAGAMYGVNTTKTEAFDWSRFKKQPEVGARTLEKQSNKASVNYELYISNQKTDRSQLRLERLLVELPKAEEEKRRPMLSITSNRRKAPESISSLNTKADKMLAAAKEAVLSNPFDVVRLNFENLYELYDLYLEGGEDDMRVKTVISKLDDFLKDLKAKDKKAYEKTYVQLESEITMLYIKKLENHWENSDLKSFQKDGGVLVKKIQKLNSLWSKHKYDGNLFSRLDSAKLDAMVSLFQGNKFDGALNMTVNELSAIYPSKDGKRVKDRRGNVLKENTVVSEYQKDKDVRHNIRTKGSTKELLEALRPESSLVLWKELRMLTRFEQVAKLAKEALSAKIGVEQGDIEEVQKYLERYESEKSEASDKYIESITKFDPPVSPKRVSKR